MSATFGYDALDRLTPASGGWGTLGYQYDAVGNRLSSTLNGVTTAYTYDPATNRLASSSGGQVERFAYDLDGRLTSDGLSSSYSYTPTNQLEAALTQAGALNLYRYDADGQRVLKIGGAGAGTTDVVNGLSEFSTEGGPITWTVDYVYAGTRLLAAVRPAVGTLDTLQVRMKHDCRLRASGHRLQAAMPSRVTRPEAWSPKPEAARRRQWRRLVVTPTATPASGYVFVGWSGTGCATGTVQMSHATSCTATFGHRLTVSARLKSGSPYTDVQWTSSPAGINCRTSCAANFPSGTVVSLFTSEGPSSWSGDCSMRQSLTMDSDKTCIAVFNNYYGPIRLGAQTPTAESATDDTPSVAPPPETAAPGGESGAPATSSAVASGLGAAVVTLSMDTPTTLQVVEYYHVDALALRHGARRAGRGAGSGRP